LINGTIFSPPRRTQRVESVLRRQERIPVAAESADAYLRQGHLRKELMRGIDEAPARSRL